MNIHIALYKWKDNVTPEQVKEVFHKLGDLGPKVPGLISITCTRNDSKYSEGYTHIIFVRGENQAAIDAYRAHPLHKEIADQIDSMEDKGIGIDFSTKS